MKSISIIAIMVLLSSSFHQPLAFAQPSEYSSEKMLLGITTYSLRCGFIYKPRYSDGRVLYVCDPGRTRSEAWNDDERLQKVRDIVNEWGVPATHVFILDKDLKLSSTSRHFFVPQKALNENDGDVKVLFFQEDDPKIGYMSDNYLPIEDNWLMGSINTVLDFFSPSEIPTFSNETPYSITYKKEDGTIMISFLSREVYSQVLKLFPDYKF